MITLDQYTELRARYDRMQTWVNSLRKNPRAMVSYNPADVPADCVISNDETALLEVYEFMTEKPARYFAYFNEKNRTVTGFTGVVLGHVTYVNRKRQYGIASCPVWHLEITGANGIRYYGRHYPQAGNYVRMTAYKHQPE